MPFSFGMKSLFSPEDDVHAEILKEVSAAQKSIYMMIYGYTLSDLTDVLIAKHQAGILVRCVLDHTQSAGVTEKVQVQRLIAAGIDLVIGTSPEAHQIIHEKGICVDEVHTFTGSYNLSPSAQKQINHADFVYSSDRAQWFISMFNSLYTWVKTNEPQYQITDTPSTSDTTAPITPEPTPQALSAN